MRARWWPACPLRTGIWCRVRSIGGIFPASTHAFADLPPGRAWVAGRPIVLCIRFNVSPRPTSVARLVAQLTHKLPVHVICARCGSQLDLTLTFDAGDLVPDGIRHVSGLLHGRFADLDLLVHDRLLFDLDPLLAHRYVNRPFGAGVYRSIRGPVD